MGVGQSRARMERDPSARTSKESKTSSISSFDARMVSERRMPCLNSTLLSTAPEEHTRVSECKDECARMSVQG